jgi:phosphoenolpyruvate synthase/pyruvate phosphate dikinase
VTETFEPGKKLSSNMANGGFVTITDGATFAYDLLLHQTLPDGFCLPVTVMD